MYFSDDAITNVDRKLNPLLVQNFEIYCKLDHMEIEVAPHHKPIKKLLMDDDQLINDALFRALKRGQDNCEITRSKDLRSLTDFICSSIAGMRVYARLKNDRKWKQYRTRGF